MRRSEVLQGWRCGVFGVVLMGTALLGTEVSAIGSSMPETQVEPASAEQRSPRQESASLPTGTPHLKRNHLHFAIA